MAYQSKDVLVLGQQLKVQKIVLLANNTLLTVSGSDLSLAMGEPVKQVMSCMKQIAAGTISGIACTVSGNNIIITGESAAAATTSYVIHYIIDEQV